MALRALVAVVANGDAVKAHVLDAVADSTFTLDNFFDLSTHRHLRFTPPNISTILDVVKF
jgi:hypothetical protein